MCRFPEEDGDRYDLSGIPMGRIGSPEDYGEAILWLAAGADYITGQCINVDGGITT